MTTLKYFVGTILLTLILTSCNNSADNVLTDNHYQLRKQLFKYKGSVDLTADIKKNAVDFMNDSLEHILKGETEKAILYIDSIKTYLIDYFKVPNPDSFTKDEIANYSFKDSLFSYASLNFVFCGEGGQPPDTRFNAFRLRKVLNNYYETIGRLINDKTNKQILYPSDYTDRDGVIIQWEYQYFFKNNLITTLTNLEKVKQDVYLTFVNIKNHRRHEP